MRFNNCVLPLAMSIFVAAFVVAPALAGTDYYVDKTYGNDGNSGTSWGHAFATIDRARNACAQNDGPETVHVAEGIYKEWLPFRNESRDYYTGIALLGGYPCGGGERNPEANRTIIIGNSSSRTVEFNGVPDARIDGFTISNAAERTDGGLAIVDCSPIVANCILCDNKTDGGGAAFDKGGAGIWIQNASPKIKNCVIRDNTSYVEGDGAGILVVTWSGRSSRPEILDCVITGNRIIDSNGTGAGIAFKDYGGEANHIAMKRCVIADNSPESSDGVGGMRLMSADISDCLIAENGGASAISVDVPEDSVFRNCTIANNEGCGIYTDPTVEAELQLINCILWDNNDDLQWIDCAGISHCDIEDGDCSGQNSNFSADPLFVFKYYLSQTDAGQDHQSPCVNAGDGTAASYGLNEYTTRTDGINDTGIVDIGYHFDCEATAPDLSNGDLTPKAGTPDTEFTYSVHYYQAEESPPSLIKVHIDDDSGHDMTLDEGYAYDGTYTYHTTLAKGEHTFYFYCEDGRGTADRDPNSGTYDGPSVTQDQGEYFVDKANGDDSNSGMSWSDAFATIGRGIEACNSGWVRDPDVVHVAAETYYENVSLHSYITLLGGYPPGGGKRDWEANETVIDGSEAGSVVIATDVEGVLIDGFSITNGKAQYGGGLYVENTNLHLFNCAVEGNKAYLDEYSDKAAGGGLYVLTSTLSLFNCAIDSNTAYHEATSADAVGGGLRCSDSILTMTGCAVSNNLCYAYSHGRPGGNYNIACAYGGGLFLGSCEASIVDCEFNDNAVKAMAIQYSYLGLISAAYGGGIYSSSTLLDLSDARVLNNEAGLSFEVDDVNSCTSQGFSPPDHSPMSGYDISRYVIGAGISLAGSSSPDLKCHVHNCLIAHNRITSEFGYANYGAIEAGGIGIYPSKGTRAPQHILSNCTIANNDKHGVYSSSDRNPELRNCIIWGNEDDVCGVDCLNITHCDIGDGDCDSGDGNISEDPLFIEGYHLSQMGAGQYQQSPCVDAGDDYASEYSLDTYTTRTDLGPDLHLVDMGWHYPLDDDRHGPFLRDGKVEPEYGREDTTFNYLVRFIDYSGEPPRVIKVFIDHDNGHSMDFASGSRFDGIYSYETHLSEGVHEFYFYCEDNDGGTHREPEGGDYRGPEVDGDTSLSKGSVDPQMGTSDTVFRFSVDYSDINGYPPSMKRVHIDGDVGHDMTLDSGDPADGKYIYETMLAAGQHVFYFYFSNGHGDSDRDPESGSYDGPLVRDGSVMYYVDCTYGDNSNSGLSWGEAVATILTGIKKCKTGFEGCPDVLNVAAGIYVENISTPDYLTMLGGYPPGGGSRDAEANETIIDGDAAGPVIVINEDFEVTIDGFTIQNGLADHGAGVRCYSCSPTFSDCIFSANILDKSGPRHKEGGGLYCEESSPVLHGCSFIKNSAETSQCYGLGIFLKDSSAILMDCEFIENSADGWCRGGGGICCEGSSPEMTNCVFQGNVADRGGGIYMDDYSNPTLIDCMIIENRTQSTEGHGGGIYSYDCSPTLIDCEISDNFATLGGGGILIYGAEAQPALVRCLISNNAAGDHGGGLCFGCDLTLMDCQIINNVAETAEGGGIYVTGGDPAISSCDISGNVALSGGGVYSWKYDGLLLLTNCLITDNSSDVGGGVMCAIYDEKPTSISLSNCTIADNVASEENGGAGVYCETSCDATLSNSIIWDNLANGESNEFGGDGSMVATYSDIEGGWEGEGNIDADPLFVQGYFLSQTAAGQPEQSPCVDAGDDYSSEYGLNTLTTRTDRVPDSGIVDMGYHYSTVVHHDDPVLSDGDVDPESGTTRTTFKYSVNYYQDEGYIPSLIKVFIDNDESHDMTLDDGDPADGTYIYETSLSAGDHTFYFYCEDELGGADRDPHSGHYDGPSALQDDGEYYVDGANGDDNDNGLSWSHAFKTIQQGMRACSTGTEEEPNIIHVAANTYNENVTFRGYVTMLGGYPPGGGTRDPDVNTTTIDGGRTDRAVAIYKDLCVSIDGFTITGGKAENGGGILCELSTFQINDCLISENQATKQGGGIYVKSCDDGDSRIDGCTISDNYASNYGGGICIIGATSIISSCHISNNSTKLSGGGIYVDECEPKIRYCTIEGNSVSVVSNSETSDTEASGGGVSFIWSEHPEIRDCVIRKNSVHAENRYNQGFTTKACGGGIYSEYSGPIVTDCVVLDNDIEAISHSIYGSSKDENSPACGYGMGLAYGAGMCFWDAYLVSYNEYVSPYVWNCLVAQNELSAHGTQTGRMGGGICVQSLYSLNSPHIKCSTIVDNDANGLFIDNPSNNSFWGTTLENSILWSNGVDVDGMMCSKISHCDIEDGDCEGDSGNFSEDPLFVDGYYLSQTASGQSQQSPCVDAGSDSASNAGMSSRTTRTDGVYDTGQVDVGYHYRDGSGQHNPILSQGAVSPKSGSTDLSYTFSVHYFDEDGDAPVAKRVYIDDSAGRDMALQNGDTADGTYSVAVSLKAGNHKFYFSFSDENGRSDREPEAGTFDGPTVYPDSALSEGAVSPTVGTEGTIYVFSAYYYDESGTPPSTMHVYVDDNAHSMSLSDGDQAQGTYSGSVNLPAETHEFYFHFANEHGIEAREPKVGTFDGPKV
ncbi:MAG: right-handed parallel beta-helix repeat-containing protein, partial [Candidatus Coatesbacteria bacterium]|nr:right-handed parallel beta-helix repeat-containing protein [Candidatus Coatesbacteria bacterium]